jgi:hypothetical protein
MNTTVNGTPKHISIDTGFGWGDNIDITQCALEFGAQYVQDDGNSYWKFTDMQLQRLATEVRDRCESKPSVTTEAPVDNPADKHDADQLMLNLSIFGARLRGVRGWAVSQGRNVPPDTLQDQLAALSNLIQHSVDVTILVPEIVGTELHPMRICIKLADIHGHFTQAIKSCSDSRWFGIKFKHKAHTVDSMHLSRIDDALGEVQRMVVQMFPDMHKRRVINHADPLKITKAGA